MGYQETVLFPLMATGEKRIEMHYVMLIYTDPAAFGELAPEEIGSLTTEVMEFDKAISDSGNNLGSIRLQPGAMAKAIRVRAGKPLTTDGPFSEAKEQLGGIYLIEAEDDTEAAEIASRLPVARIGTVELRPALGMDIRGQVFQMYDEA